MNNFILVYETLFWPKIILYFIYLLLELCLFYHIIVKFLHKIFIKLKIQMKSFKVSNRRHIKIFIGQMGYTLIIKFDFYVYNKQ